MDPGSNVTAASSELDAPPDQDGTSSTVHCDQAIFTSVRSAVGSGYRLVAASRGLRAEEKQQIVKRSPSHDGLCHTGPEAVGISFYPLSSGRLGVAYTCCAGLEQTARGGQRVYTRVALLQPQDFGRFRYNPFQVVRSLVASGQAEPDLEPPPELPTLRLLGGYEPDFNGLSDCVDQVGSGWLRCVLSRVLQGQPVVVVGDFPLPALIESVLLGLPGLLRARLSFTAGLRYSLGRGFELSALTGDTTRLQQTLRGQGIDLLQPAADRPAPTPSHASWGRMVERRWEQGRWDDLDDLTSRHYLDCSIASSEVYGQLCCRRDELEDLDSGELIAMLGEYVGTRPPDELATELTVALVSDALRRLTDLLSTAPLDDLTRHWVAVADLWRRPPATAAWLAPLVGAMLKRMTRLSPIEAAQAASRIVADVRARSDHSPVRQALDDLLDHLGEWLHDQPTDNLHLLEAPLRRWPPAGLFADRVRQLQNQITARPAAQATAKVEPTP